MYTMYLYNMYIYIYIICCIYIYTYVASDIFWNVFVEEHLAFSGIYLGFLILGYIKEEFDFSMKWKFE